MRETLTILEKLEELKKNGEKAVLATVVRTSGSTYRKEGAKLLISETGEMVGSISAGCLENDVREIAREVLKSGEPRLLRYDNTAAEDIIWGLGLGCNGVVEVFVEAVK
ncbi:MAG: XdhC family protein [Calditrichaeota bacterium]|nr:MAG: XdhC family protein [Calditrichota bacterium]